MKFAHQNAHLPLVVLLQLHCVYSQKFEGLLGAGSSSSSGGSGAGISSSHSSSITSSGSSLSGHGGTDGLAEGVSSSSSSSGVVAGMPTVQPKFLSRGHLYKAVVGDTIELPCKVQNLGSFVLLWRRGASVLTAGHLKITRDPRFQIVGDYNLQIGGVRTQDAGDYICQIGDQETRDQVHTVEILVPPTLRAVPQNGQVAARKGSTVTLECKASGNPVPTIYWYKKDIFSGSTHLSDSSSLILERVDRHHAGIYQCAADNGVKDPVSMDIHLTILSPPEITVEKSWVHAAEGYDVELACIVHGGDVTSDMMWYQNSFLLDQSDRRSMESKGERYAMLIRNFQASDFGNYSCVADNALGRTKKYIEISGRPGPASFISPMFSGSLDYYNLTWSIESIPPLDEIRLLYRRLWINETYQHPGKWQDIILKPNVQRADNNNFIMSHVIHGLERYSVYEAIVQAKNRYGWNEISDIHQFFTKRVELQTSEDLEYKMSSSSSSASSAERLVVISISPVVAAFAALMLMMMTAPSAPIAAKRK